MFPLAITNSELDPLIFILDVNGYVKNRNYTLKYNAERNLYLIKATEPKTHIFIIQQINEIRS